MLLRKSLYTAVWLLDATIYTDGTVFINGHWRADNAGPPRPEEGTYAFQEGDGRVVQEVVIGPPRDYGGSGPDPKRSTTYEVRNKKNVFAYGRPEA